MTLKESIWQFKYAQDELPYGHRKMIGITLDGIKLTPEMLDSNEWAVHWQNHYPEFSGLSLEYVCISETDYDVEKLTLVDELKGQVESWKSQSLQAGLRTYDGMYQENVAVKAEVDRWKLKYEELKEEYSGVRNTLSKVLPSRPYKYSLVIKCGAYDKILKLIAGMCGTPDAADGCRNILKAIKEFEQDWGGINHDV